MTLTTSHHPTFLPFTMNQMNSTSMKTKNQFSAPSTPTPTPTASTFSSSSHYIGRSHHPHYASFLSLQKAQLKLTLKKNSKSKRNHIDTEHKGQPEQKEFNDEEEEEEEEQGVRLNSFHSSFIHDFEEQNENEEDDHENDDLGSDSQDLIPPSMDIKKEPPHSMSRKRRKTLVDTTNMDSSLNNTNSNTSTSNALSEARKLRKAFLRKTIDYNSELILLSELRQQLYPYSRYSHWPAIQPDIEFLINMMPPSALLDQPMNACTTKFVHTSMNKFKSYVNAVRWTPEGRRLITGSASGEFTLWNGLTFNFETILQAHGSSVRSMKWSRNDLWLISGDHQGYIKYWQSNMNHLNSIQAHKEAIRGLSFSPLDTKLATCSDDQTVKIWQFHEAICEHVFVGHGWDVKCLDWHPAKSLVVSGGKDQVLKLWDPKMKKCVSTIHGHKNTVHSVTWNANGHWLLSGSRDQMIKLYDLRTMTEIVQFKGHPNEVCSLSWHPQHESLFASGGSDGTLFFWNALLGSTPLHHFKAHETNIWAMDWHPLGHVLCTGSNDYTTRFWTRARPGEQALIASFPSVPSMNTSSTSTSSFRSTSATTTSSTSFHSSHSQPKPPYVSHATALPRSVRDSSLVSSQSQSPLLNDPNASSFIPTPSSASSSSSLSHHRGGTQLGMHVSSSSSGSPLNPWHAKDASAGMHRHVYSHENVHVGRRFPSQDPSLLSSHSSRFSNSTKPERTMEQEKQGFNSGRGEKNSNKRAMEAEEEDDDEEGFYLPGFGTIGLIRD